MSHDHERWLIELTSLPTATGREWRVAAWVRAWAAARGLEVVADRFGNLLVQRPGSRGKRPILFAAHMDHPAFVVIRSLDARRVAAEFRGGVNDSYFKGTPVRLFHGDAPPRRGVVEDFHSSPDKDNFGANDGGKRLIVRFDADIDASPGDVLMWDTGPARVEGDRLHAPACDDLAGVAAALGALDMVMRESKKSRGKRPDVRVLLTRAEEVGFIGAIAAAKHRTFPIGSRVIAIENSKSFPESPIGAGPIVRVGDFTSTFDPDLTYRAGRIAADLAKTDPAFKYQRKLMPGGTCEASAYQCYGYTATCLCLPLGNYHNMNEAAGKIDAETISLADYHGMIRLLARIGMGLDNKQTSPPLKARMEKLLKERGKHLRER